MNVTYTPRPGGHSIYANGIHTCKDCNLGFPTLTDFNIHLERGCRGSMDRPYAVDAADEAALRRLFGQRSEKALVEDIIAYEEGTLNAPDTLDLFAELIRTGRVWRMQGSYGRAASGFIDSGLITRDGKVTDEGHRVAEGDL